MFEEHGPGREEIGRPILPPTVWEKMREYAQEVAHGMEARLRGALADGQHREEIVQVHPPLERRTEQLTSGSSRPEADQRETGMAELHLAPLTTRQDNGESTDLVITRFPCLLGRSPDCDERFDNLMVSRRHCLLSLRDGRVWVEDLSSMNGTRLNGLRLEAPQSLGDGDTLQVAHLAFRIHLVGGARDPEFAIAHTERGE